MLVTKQNKTKPCFFQFKTVPFKRGSASREAGGRWHIVQVPSRGRHRLGKGSLRAAAAPDLGRGGSGRVPVYEPYLCGSFSGQEFLLLSSGIFCILSTLKELLVNEQSRMHGYKLLPKRNLWMNNSAMNEFLVYAK